MSGQALASLAPLRSGPAGVGHNRAIVFQRERLVKVKGSSQAQAIASKHVYVGRGRNRTADTFVRDAEQGTIALVEVIIE